MYGIQVNVGTVVYPNWRFMFNVDGEQIVFPSTTEAMKFIKDNYAAKSSCFRVEEV